MNELIKIDQDGKITAKDLYEFLQLDSGNYSRWCKTNIEDNVFYQEGVDWWGFLTMKNGNETKDYQLTIDFAKHLCMLSRSERGKQARSYFVEVEKRHNTLVQPQSVEDLIILQAQSVKELKAQVSQQGEAIKQLAAKIETIPDQYYSIAGFASLRGAKIDLSKAGLLGRKAAKLSHEYGIDIGKVYDPRFGTVNTYHLDVLNEVFDSFGAQAPL